MRDRERRKREGGREGGGRGRERKERRERVRETESWRGRRTLTKQLKPKSANLISVNTDEEDSRRFSGWMEGWRDGCIEWMDGYTQWVDAWIEKERWIEK